MVHYSRLLCFVSQFEQRPMSNQSRTFQKVVSFKEIARDLIGWTPSAKSDILPLFRWFKSCTRGYEKPVIESSYLFWEWGKKRKKNGKKAFFNTGDVQPHQWNALDKTILNDFSKHGSIVENYQSIKYVPTIPVFFSRTSINKEHPKRGASFLQWEITYK